MNNGSIGIFDSGLGGLTVAKQIIKLLPFEDIVYLGDTARFPYGPRSPEVIREFSEQDTEFLLNKKVKCIVIACNTVSAVATDYLKKKYKSVPIFEVISPAAKEVARVGKNIGVIGTRATIASGAYKDNIKKYSKSSKVFSVACPLFVPFVEEGETSNLALTKIAKNYLSKLKSKKIDTLIMGCTHYPIIKRTIAKQLANGVKIIDPGEATAKNLMDFLRTKNMLNTQNIIGKTKFYVTDLTPRFIQVAEMFLGHKISESIQKVNL